MSVVLDRLQRLEASLQETARTHRHRALALAPADLGAAAEASQQSMADANLEEAVGLGRRALELLVLFAARGNACHFAELAERIVTEHAAIVRRGPDA